jgi:hypothetical protein
LALFSSAAGSAAGAPVAQRASPARGVGQPDVYEGFPRKLAISGVSTPCAPAQRFSTDLPARHADYLHFANGAFAGCSIPDPHSHTYRSGVG